MLSPKRTKFRKQQRGRLRGKACRGNTIVFGDYALQAITRRTITRYVKRGGKLWIRVFPDKPITARAAETRMGAGKGAPEYWVAVVKPGHIIFEIKGVPANIASEAMKKASYKLPIKTKFITKQDSNG